MEPQTFNNAEVETSNNKIFIYHFPFFYNKSFCKEKI